MGSRTQVRKSGKRSTSRGKRGRKPARRRRGRRGNALRSLSYRDGARALSPNAGAEQKSDVVFGEHEVDPIVVPVHEVNFADHEVDPVTVPVQRVDCDDHVVTADAPRKKADATTRKKKPAPSGKGKGKGKLGGGKTGVQLDGTVYERTHTIPLGPITATMSVSIAGEMYGAKRKDPVGVGVKGGKPEASLRAYALNELGDVKLSMSSKGGLELKVASTTIPLNVRLAGDSIVIQSERKTLPVKIGDATVLLKPRVSLILRGNPHVIRAAYSMLLGAAALGAVALAADALAAQILAGLNGLAQGVFGFFIIFIPPGALDDPRDVHPRDQIA